MLETQQSSHTPRQLAAAKRSNIQVIFGFNVTPEGWQDAIIPNARMAVISETPEIMTADENVKQALQTTAQQGPRVGVPSWVRNPAAEQLVARRPSLRRVGRLPSIEDPESRPPTFADVLLLGSQKLNGRPTPALRVRSLKMTRESDD
ncbi:hypothetical protein RUND412_003952 [Rhizina undulata]